MMNQQFKFDSQTIFNLLNKMNSLFHEITAHNSKNLGKKWILLKTMWKGVVFIKYIQQFTTFFSNVLKSMINEIPKFEPYPSSTIPKRMNYSYGERGLPKSPF